MFFKLCLLYMALVVSAAIPPLLIVTVPLTIFLTIRLVRRYRYLRRSEAAYYRHQEIARIHKLTRP